MTNLQSIERTVLPELYEDYDIMEILSVLRYITLRVKSRRNFRGPFDMVYPYPPKIHKLRKFEIEIPPLDRAYFIRVILERVNRIEENEFEEPNSSLPKMSFTENNYTIVNPGVNRRVITSQYYNDIDRYNNVDVYLSTQSVPMVREPRQGNDKYTIKIYLMYTELDKQEIYSNVFSPVKNKNFEPSNKKKDKLSAIHLDVLVH